jgi:hypothetical protein
MMKSQLLDQAEREAGPLKNIAGTLGIPKTIVVT